MRDNGTRNELLSDVRCAVCGHKESDHKETLIRGPFCTVCECPYFSPVKP